MSEVPEKWAQEQRMGNTGERRVERDTGVGGGSGDAMATGRGWLEPYIFCCGFILLLKISKMGHGTIISVFER